MQSFSPRLHGTPKYKGTGMHDQASKDMVTSLMKYRRPHHEMFTCFTRLPLELRRMIWRDTFPPSRFVYLRVTMEPVCHPRYFRTSYRSSCSSPIALQVCQESRSEALRFYDICIGKNDCSLPSFHFSSKFDILIVDPVSAFIMPNSIFDSEDIDRIQNICVPEYTLPTSERFRYYWEIKSSYRRFTDLKTVAVIPCEFPGTHSDTKMFPHPRQRRALEAEFTLRWKTVMTQRKAPVVKVLLYSETDKETRYAMWTSLNSEFNVPEDKLRRARVLWERMEKKLNEPRSLRLLGQWTLRVREDRRNISVKRDWGKRGDSDIYISRVVKRKAEERRSRRRNTK